jgi:hypothetical protein
MVYPVYVSKHQNVNETHAQRVNYRAQCEKKFNASDIPQCFPPHFTVFTFIAIALRMSSEKKREKKKTQRTRGHPSA